MTPALKRANSLPLGRKLLRKYPPIPQTDQTDDDESDPGQALRHCQWSLAQAIPGVTKEHQQERRSDHRSALESSPRGEMPMEKDVSSK